ncbi:MAG TPA: glutathione S-transferase family protein [Solimonas sp.]|nr:glutathione S-transferase family protein [Solimonas sp.]
MILIGMFDSPFVRRVAVSLETLGYEFEHYNWSVGKDQLEIRKYNPLGRVPVLVLDSGESLIESSAMLDYLDGEVGPQRALIPPAGAERRRALHLLGLLTGAMDKGIQRVYDRVFKPVEKHHQPWIDRCTDQMKSALALLETECAKLAPDAWLLGAQPMQPDITLGCFITYLKEAAFLDLAAYPAIKALVERCEALPAFQAVYAPFSTPKVK